MIITLRCALDLSWVEWTERRCVGMAIVDVKERREFGADWQTAEECYYALRRRFEAKQ